jgi:hypothetical protein
LNQFINRAVKNPLFRAACLKAQLSIRHMKKRGDRSHPVLGSFRGDQVLALLFVLGLRVVVRRQEGRQFDR